MREATLTDMERLGAFDEAERTFQMTEEAFRVFYELTARPVRIYLARMCGDDRAADDLLQETYYRFLRSTGAIICSGLPPTWSTIGAGGRKSNCRRSTARPRPWRPRRASIPPSARWPAST
jgi:DNA-directed RNA polymerase specialized sigma24 family protein